MTRVCVIGGRGFYGARVVACMRSLGYGVMVGSRSNTEVHIGHYRCIDP